MPVHYGPTDAERIKALKALVADWKEWHRRVAAQLGLEIVERTWTLTTIEALQVDLIKAMDLLREARPPTVTDHWVDNYAVPAPDGAWIERRDALLAKVEAARKGPGVVEDGGRDGS